MSDTEVLETSPDERFRVRLVLDEYPDEPYDDGQSPLLRLEYRDYHGWRATHVMATGRPLDDDSRIEEAAERWGYGQNAALLEKYLHAYHGTREIESWHSGDYWYVTYDTARWREYAGLDQPGSTGHIDMSEYRAYVEGNVWFYVVERRVTWKPVDAPADDDVSMTTWETVDSCGGFYGDEYAREAALEAFGYVTEPYEHMRTEHEISADFLAKWDEKTVTRKHEQYHQMARDGQITVSHTHDDPRAPFAITPEPGPAIAAGTRVRYTVMYNDGRGMGQAHIERRPAFGKVTRIRPGGSRNEPRATIAVEDPKPGAARYVERYVADLTPAPEPVPAS